MSFSQVMDALSDLTLGMDALNNKVDVLTTKVNTLTARVVKSDLLDDVYNKLETLEVYLTKGYDNDMPEFWGGVIDRLQDIEYKINNLQK